MGDKKNASSELRKTNDLLERIFSTSHFLLAYLDKDFNFIRVNRAYAQADGHPAEFFIGKNHFQLFPNEENERIFRKVLETGERYSVEAKPFEYALNPERGMTYWDWSLEAVKDSTGEKVEGVLLSLVDVTGRIRAEAERVRLAAAVEQAAESVIITDNDGNIQYVNPAFERVTGYSKSEALGKNPRILKSGKHDYEFYKDIWGAITRGDTWRGRFINKRKDGTLFEEDASIRPLRSPSGAITSFVAVKRDVTREAMLEKQVRRTQRLESVGTLAGGIAHDFNNILTAIIGFAEMSLADIREENELKDNIRETLAAAMRARELIKQILTFSRDTEQQLRPMQLQPVIRESLKLIRASTPAMIEIAEELDMDAGMALADPTQMSQVIMNLCTNAEYAMRAKGGTLTVSLTSIDADQDFAKNHLHMKPGPHLRLTVTDTGVGMDERVLERIFEPFFSTKPHGEGVGMGLSVVHGIVVGHGGSITVYSEPGVGTSFNVYLPVIGKAGETVETVKQPIPGGDERVLFVDDEESITSMAKKMLERVGYRVEVTNKPERALELFKANPDFYDILITDQSMPDITGAELARQVMDIRPSLPVILCTGFSHSITPYKAKELGIREFIMKPFAASELAQAMRRSLEGKPAKKNGRKK
ncbi:MAG: PAS domain S-box protein [Nitrospinae bacterium]|nr:PAS domain S-box protein [Nitrospinota bacterium]